jgi:hypothetical protein
MIATPSSFLLPNNAITTEGQRSDFLSKYSIILPTAIASMAFSGTVKPLDSSYQPGSYDVICGRGKGSYNRPGNKHFRALVATYIPEYQRARSKVDKSAILNSIVDKVRSLVNPETGEPAQFVKHTKSTGWVQIGDDHAREKVGHAIREAVTARDGRAPSPPMSSINFPVESILQQTNAHQHPSFAPLSEFDSVVEI